MKDLPDEFKPVSQPSDLLIPGLDDAEVEEKNREERFRCHVWSLVPPYLVQ